MLVAVSDKCLYPYISKWTSSLFPEYMFFIVSTSYYIALYWFAIIISSIVLSLLQERLFSWIALSIRIYMGLLSILYVNTKKRPFQKLFWNDLIFVGLLGFEPRKTGPDSVVLPLHHSTIRFLTHCHLFWRCKGTTFL